MSHVSLDIRPLSADERLPQIFRVFDQLPAGGSLTLQCDEHPRDLHYQFRIQREGLYSWNYRAEGDGQWCVQLSKLGLRPAVSDGNCCGSCGG